MATHCTLGDFLRVLDIEEKYFQYRDDSNPHLTHGEVTIFQRCVCCNNLLCKSSEFANIRPFKKDDPKNYHCMKCQRLFEDFLKSLPKQALQKAKEELEAQRSKPLLHKPNPFDSSSSLGNAPLSSMKNPFVKGD